MSCAVRKYNYDMLYTSNARGQAEKTMFIAFDYCPPRRAG